MSATQSASTAQRYSRKKPAILRLKAARFLTGRDSNKDTRHYEFELGETELFYEPGDSLAIFPENCPHLVNEFLEVLGYAGDEKVPAADGRPISIRQALTMDYTITQPSQKLMDAVFEKVGLDAVYDLTEQLIEEGELSGDLVDSLEEFDELADEENPMNGLEIIDILQAFTKFRPDPTTFVGLLRKLTPRLYSIASSLNYRPGELHLCVATVRFSSYGRKRKGVCSNYLAERVKAGTQMRCFVSPGKGFRLPPPDSDVPIIMVGPGTGIAPFRAFIEERIATNAKGKSWLFFGEQHEQSDFFYQEDLEGHVSSGALTRLTTAFSRDQEEKVYVQHRLAEHAEELCEWLNDGASIYVCGDAKRMAVDVDATLRKIVQTYGGVSEEEAADYLRQLQKEKRYCRDVY